MGVFKKRKESAIEMLSKNKQPIKKEGKIETSKLLTFFILGNTELIIIASFIAVFITGDTSALAYLIPGQFGVTATVVGFYFWKAKCENLQKYGRQDAIDGNINNNM
jgi:hypothetical protein